MLRTHNCGELRITDQGKTVMLCGWVQKSRDLGGMTFIDLRDRYGITQLVFNQDTRKELCDKAREVGREYVLQIEGVVLERSNKNLEIPTGEIEIDVIKLDVLNPAKLPPFTIEDQTDGGEELRMKYRFLDLRRKPVMNKLMHRSRVSFAIRKHLQEADFLEIETPFLIKSTPEGARDFVVPSRMNPGEFYALPQSPQTFKQLLMVSGYDKYYQIVKCFRDEDLRADRQPEFTQLDCEMSFVEQEDILQTFENLVKNVFKEVGSVTLSDFPRMSYDDAMRLYGSDKPDIRFDMQFVELNDLTQNKGFNVFDQAELVVAICVPKGAEFTRKVLDKYTDYVRRPQVGAKGMVWAKYNEDDTYKSSVDKFYSQDDVASWFEKAKGSKGDLIMILAGEKNKTRSALNELRLKVADDLGLRKTGEFAPLWVVDFPLLEYDEDSARWHAMHHPFTSPKTEDVDKLNSDPGAVRANAYDLVINGVELGGGSIRIHNRSLQEEMFKVLGFTQEEALSQFGFLLNAFEFGAPPHGGIAFGLDRWAAVMEGSESIRDYIAFPKNNAGRDVMLDAPAELDREQLKELHIAVENEEKTVTS